MRVAWAVPSHLARGRAWLGLVWGHCETRENFVNTSLLSSLEVRDDVNPIIVKLIESTKIVNMPQ